MICLNYIESLGIICKCVNIELYVNTSNYEKYNENNTIENWK